MTKISEITDIIKDSLEAAGFLAVGEYSAADSLLHREEYIGFCGVREYSVADEAVKFDGGTIFVELEGRIVIRLMGKAGNYSDGEELNKRCDEFFLALARDSRIAVNGARLCETSQSLPLHRLEKRLELDVRVCIEEETADEKA